MDTLIAVFAGALAAAVPTTGLALLQRKWAVKDMTLKWKQERQARLLEKRQEAHLAFLDALHEVQRILDSGDVGFMDALDVLSHSRSRIQAYASLDALRLGTRAAQAMLQWASALHADHEEVDAFNEAALDAVERYENAVRLEIATDADDPILQEVIRSSLTEGMPDEAA